MQFLPTKSEASITTGLWFVFPVGGNTIRAWGSGMSGLERIYIDDAVVSERRSMGRSSTHTFAVAGQEYAVAFRTISSLKGQLECSLFKDGKSIKAYLAKYSGPKPFSAIRLSLGIVASFGIGLLAIYFKLPVWPVLGLFALVVVIVQRKTRQKGSFSIEEITSA